MLSAGDFCAIIPYPTLSMWLLRGGLVGQSHCFILEPQWLVQERACLLVCIVVSISACHSGDQGSVPDGEPKNLKNKIKKKGPMAQVCPMEAHMIVLFFKVVIRGKISSIWGYWGIEHMPRACSIHLDTVRQVCLSMELTQRKTQMGEGTESSDLIFWVPGSSHTWS